jgi:hypothetical protein
MTVKSAIFERATRLCSTSPQIATLAHRRGLHGHVDDIGAEPLAGDLKRGARAGRILEKAVDQRPAAQQRVLLLGLPVQLDIAVGQIEDMANVVRRQPLDAEEVPVPEAVFLHEFPL